MTKAEELTQMKGELARLEQGADSLEKEIKILEASLKVDRLNFGFKRGRIYKHPYYITEYRGIREPALVRVTKVVDGRVYYAVQDANTGKMSMRADSYSDVEHIKDTFVYMGEDLKKVL